MTTDKLVEFYTIIKACEKAHEAGDMTEERYNEAMVWVGDRLFKWLNESDRKENG